MQTYSAQLDCRSTLTNLPKVSTYILQVQLIESLAVTETIRKWSYPGCLVRLRARKHCNPKFAISKFLAASQPPPDGRVLITKEPATSGFHVRCRIRQMQPNESDTKSDRRKPRLGHPVPDLFLNILFYSYFERRRFAVTGRVYTSRMCMTLPLYWPRGRASRRTWFN